MKALFDTNILIDYLNGVALARDEIARYDAPSISIVSWVEVMVGVPHEDEASVRAFLKRFLCYPVETDVADTSLSIRRTRRCRLPDAIIWATARVNEALLVTRNTRDFPGDDPFVRVPYEL